MVLHSVEKKTLEQNVSISGRKAKTVCKWTILAILFFLILVYILIYYDVYDHLYYLTFAEESEVAVDGWGFNTNRSTSLYISPGKDTILLHNSQLCSEPMFLLIIVCSSPKRHLKRKVIRKTWGNFSGLSYKVAFLLGIPENTKEQKIIEQEAKEHNDIIQENFIDSYNNLTLKSVMLLKYVYNHCDKVNYILKTDDDMFIHVQNLVNFLENNFGKSAKKFLMGRLIRYGRPRRYSKSKWYSPKYIYPDNYYPNYLSGLGYVMDRETAISLYQAALTTPILHFEDVYVTGICAEKAKIQRLNHFGFSSDMLPLDPCLYKYDNNIFTSHGHFLGDMEKLWSGLKNETLCSGLSWKYWSIEDLIKVSILFLIFSLLVCMSRIFSCTPFAVLNLFKRKRLY